MADDWEMARRSPFWSRLQQRGQGQVKSMAELPNNGWSIPNQSDGDGEQPYMLDTNVFNDTIWGRLSLSSFEQRRLIATGIQRDELSNTRDGAKRTELLGRFDTISPDVVPSSSFAFDIEGAGWDQAHWNDGRSNFERMLQRLQELDRQKKGRKDPQILNQERDVLIAETAIRIGAVLISGDGSLCCVVTEFGGQALNAAKLS